MSIVSLFCNVDDFFLAYESHLASHSLDDGNPSETRGRPRSLHPSEVDDPYCVPPKRVSDVQTLLRKTGVCLLACGVSKSGELLSTQERSANAFDPLSSCELGGM